PRHTPHPLSPLSHGDFRPVAKCKFLDDPDTDPLERQGTHGGLMCVALGTLLLIIDLGPEGMSNRLCGPLHKRLPEELWTLETPVHPGLLAAAFGHRCDPCVFLQCSGGGIAFSLF